MRSCPTTLRWAHNKTITQFGFRMLAENFKRLGLCYVLLPKPETQTSALIILAIMRKPDSMIVNVN